MNRLIKQLFTPNSPVAQLTEHKNKDGEGTAGEGFKSKGVLLKFCLNFHKMNRCHYLLVSVIVILLFPNE